MGCNCGQSKSGATIVWQHHGPDGVKTYATEADAKIAQARAGGRGPIVRGSQTAK